MNQAGRDRFRECVHNLVAAIEDGTVTPKVDELGALLFLCSREELESERRALLVVIEQLLEESLRETT